HQGEARAECQPGAAPALHARARPARAGHRPAAPGARVISEPQAPPPSPARGEGDGDRGALVSHHRPMTAARFRYKLRIIRLARGTPMSRRYLIVAVAAGALISTGALAQDVKVGVVLPLTGGLAPVGKQVQAGIKLYMDKNGASVNGKKIDLIVKDDGGVPDNSKRLAQELIVNDKVAIVGSALTPSAMAIGPL